MVDPFAILQRADLRVRDVSSWRPGKRKRGGGGDQRSLLVGGAAESIEYRLLHAEPSGRYGGRIVIEEDLSRKAGELEDPPGLDAATSWVHRRDERDDGPGYLVMVTAFDEFESSRDVEKGVTRESEAAAEIFTQLADMGVHRSGVSGAKDKSARVRGALLGIGCWPGRRTEIVFGVVIRHPWAVDGVAAAFEHFAVKQRIAGLAGRPLLVDWLDWTDEERLSRPGASMRRLVPADHPEIVSALAERRIVALMNVAEEDVGCTSWNELPGMIDALKQHPDLAEIHADFLVEWGVGEADGRVVLRIAGGAGRFFRTTVGEERLAEIPDAVVHSLNRLSRPVEIARVQRCFLAGGALTAAAQWRAALSLRVEIDIATRILAGQPHWEFKGWDERVPSSRPRRRGARKRDRGS